MSKAATRTALCPDVDFPAIQTQDWQSSGHLLTLGELVGGVRGLVSKKTSADEACIKVSKIAVQHWVDRNVYPLSWQMVHKRLFKDYTEFMSVRKLIMMKNSYTEATKDRYTVLKEMKDQVYDIYSLHSSQPAAKKRKADLEAELDIRMGPKENEYLQNQLSKEIARSDPRKILCVPKKMDIDPVWVAQQQKKTSLGEYYEKQIQSTVKQFETVKMDDSMADIDINNNDSDYCDEEDYGGSKKKRKYRRIPEIADDPLPQEYRHVRSGERKVLDRFYLAAGDLVGEGLSAREALKAIQVVSNRCFGRNFKLLEDFEEKEFDQDTLPSVKAVRTMVERIEAQGLASEAAEIIKKKREGVVVTHASDSTTKKAVGKFNVSGIHINKDKPLPLPVVPVAGEARDDIAEQAALGFQILAAACNPPMDPSELYKQVDLHLTDSVSHNKFLFEDVPKLFNLDHKVGQIFCATHTGLGFCRSLNSSIHIIEDKVGINNVLDGFIVQIDYESKNGSIVGQFVDCITRLVGLELRHKPWNRAEEFRKFCSSQGVSYEMFLYKDERFGCFPKACAVSLYSKDTLQDFLMNNTNIDNRLACLVRDIFHQEYAQLAMAVIAVFGIQMIEPFHAMTISKNATHKSLQIFFKDLYKKLLTPISEDFFLLDKPWYPGVSDKLFQGVKENYKLHVVQAVKEYAIEHLDEAVKLANFLQGDLATTLARLRRDYGVSEEFEAEFPVENLGDNAAENAPVHNLAMENFCGLVGHRTAKSRNLESTSRSIIIQGTKDLREKFGDNFRDYSQAVGRVKNIKLEWNKKQDELAGEKIEIKSAQNLKIEGRLLKQLDYLKEGGGPFTSCEGIDEYLAKEDISEILKKKRLKIEVQYSRDSSISLPRNNPVFRIRKRKGKGEKLQDLTPLEFGENLKILISKKISALDKKVTIASFVSVMDSMHPK